MRTFYVELPISGYIGVEIEADNEDEAIDKALESNDLSVDNVVEWEAHRIICEGNIFYGIRNEVDTYEI